MKYFDFWDDVAQEILKHVSQEQIFYYVLNAYPNLERRDYFSLFRKDKTPNCKFYYDNYGKLLFKDTAYGLSANCFEAFAIRYKLQSFSEITQLLQQFVKDNPIKKAYVHSFDNQKRDTILKTQSIELQEKDISFWKDYGITLKQLQSDNVRKVLKAMTIKSNKRTLYDFSETDSFLVYSNSKKRKKIYSPGMNYKFLANTKSDDVSLNFNREVKSLVITKSYKDSRVCKNQGVNCIWFQSENQFPNDEMLLEIVQSFDEVVVLFDNDETGIRGAKQLCVNIDLFYPGKARPLWLPIQFLGLGISDPSDLYKERGERDLNTFLKENNVQTYRNLS
jgi:hypothetical protein